MKWLWKIIVAVFALALLILAAVSVCVCYEEWDRTHEKNEIILSNDFVFRQREGRKGQVMNRNTGRVVLRRVEWLSQRQRDTLAVFCKKGKRGYLNRYLGEVVIPAQYDRAWLFAEGVAAVAKNGKIGFIDRSGKVVLPFQWKDEFCMKKSYQFGEGCCAVFDEAGKCGLIDRQGNWVLKPEYDYISDVKFGCRAVEKAEKVGLLNRALEILLPLRYDRIVIREDEIETLQAGLKQIWRKDEKTLKHEWVYDEYSDLMYWTERFTEGGERLTAISDYGYYKVWNPVRERWYYGIMRQNGEKITEAIYSNVDAIEANIFDCEAEEGGYHFILAIE